MHSRALLHPQCWWKWADAVRARFNCERHEKRRYDRTTPGASGAAEIQVRDDGEANNA